MAELVEEEKEEQKTPRARLTISRLITLLKYLLFLILLLIFIVAVSIITVRILQRQSRIQNTTGQVTLDIQQSVPEDLDWYSTLGEIRGSLLDESPVTFIVDLYIGYAPGDQSALQELTRRNVQMKERVLLYFTTQFLSDVEGARNLVRMKNELREIINRMMNNKIREVAFNNIQFISY